MKKYRSLVAWQLAHRLCLGILRTADAEYHHRARALLDQLKRAAISVEANIVEGYALGTSAQFRRHLTIALGSAAEVECLLGLALEVEYVSAEACTELLKQVDETLGVIFGLMRRIGARQAS